MKTIKKSDYVFFVDIEKTKEYYKKNTLCECPSCRNYYKQIEDKLPNLKEFLSDFGVDISRPDEATSYDEDKNINYISVDYTVCGKVKKMGEYEIDIYDNIFLSIIITDGFVSPNEQTGEYFTISVMQIELPYVLDEPFPKSITLKDDINTKLNTCYNNIKEQIENKTGIKNFLEKDGWIAFSGSMEKPELLLTLSKVKSGKNYYLYADLDDEISWQEWDYENQNDFEQAIINYIFPLINRTIKTITEKKKHKYIKISRYYLDNNKKWILIDEDNINFWLIRLFIMKDSMKEDIKTYYIKK